jgi:ABC-2 type transport system ATP-binding protein
MNEPAIDLQAVYKSFRTTEVLRGLTLQVARGKTFAFLGRNAAGKSTTIRMLLGLLRRDDGSIRVLGLDPQRDALELRRRVGYLAEDQTMYGWMRVAEILRFVAPFYPTWDHDLALRYVRDFELPAATRIKHLSKGQNVRLGLVLALAHRPELVILDDPALGLDPIMRKQFNRDRITHLQGEGRTVFYSSHLLYEVEPVADEVAILDGGRVVRQADTETLRRDVKQIILSREALAALRPSFSVLDERTDGDRMAVTVERAEIALQLLGREGVDHRAVDLNLDEIFEAYVAGRRGNGAAEATPQAALQPT